MHNIIFNWLLSFGMKLNLLKYYFLKADRVPDQFSDFRLDPDPYERIRIRNTGCSVYTYQCCQ